jgi:hypothetical protein
MLASNVMQNLQRMLPEIAAEAKARSLEFEAGDPSALISHPS